MYQGLIYQRLNINGLSSPITRHRVAGRIKKQNKKSIQCLQVTHFSFEDTHRLKVKAIPCSANQKRVGTAILFSDKIDFKPKMKGDKESHYILIKGLIYQEDITTVNIYIPKIY